MRRALALLLFLVAPPAIAQLDISFDPHPGAQVPGLDDYYGGPPVVLVLGYLGCVNLCGTTLNGVSEALRETKLVPERDYRALFVSIDPRDEKAPRERRPGWHFVTGAANAWKVASAVGFRYRYEEASGQFAHPAGFVVLTPQGRIARYFEGVRFDDVELKNAITDARQGQVHSPWEQLVLVCFHDPLGAKNTATVMMAVRIAMLLLIAVAGFFALRRLR
jgi:protein SCO1/2